MITVYHWSDGVPDASWNIEDAMIGEDTHYQACYFTGLEKPNYPMPVIPTRVEYIFGYGLADGIFIRVNEVIEAGAYRDGMLAVLPYTVN